MTTIVCLAIATVALVIGVCLGALLQAKGHQDDLNDRMF